MENLFLEINVALDNDQASGHYIIKKRHCCFVPLKDCLFIDYIIKDSGSKDRAHFV